VSSAKTRFITLFSEKKSKLNLVRSCFYFLSFLVEIIDVTSSPRPSPPIMDPTNARASGRKKNPTPNPRSNPPPIAQVLLSSFLFDINWDCLFCLIRFM
jgi:hypothetical protein